MSELETAAQSAEGAITQQEISEAIRGPFYATQRNPHIPECAFCKRQVGPLLYAFVPRKQGDKSPFKALVCGDCHPHLLTHALALLAEASEPALKAWHHFHLPELVPAKERQAVGAHLEAAQGAPKKHKRR